MPFLVAALMLTGTFGAYSRSQGKQLVVGISPDGEGQGVRAFFAEGTAVELGRVAAEERARHRQEWLAGRTQGGGQAWSNDSRQGRALAPVSTRR